jgi:hypothetical protein
MFSMILGIVIGIVLIIASIIGTLVYWEKRSKKIGGRWM